MKMLCMLVRRVVMVFVGLALGVPAGGDHAAEESHLKRDPATGGRESCLQVSQGSTVGESCHRDCNYCRAAATAGGPAVQRSRWGSRHRVSGRWEKVLFV